MSNDDKLKEAGKRLKKICGDIPKEKIIIYIVTNSTAKSNMSGRYTAYLIRDNKPYCLCYDVRITGCGLDRTFELAYNIFSYAYGIASNIRYQDYLQKENLN